jgi:hypothetical protein
MSDGTSNPGPLKCPSCGWPLVKHLTPCPLPVYDATDCAVPLMRPAMEKFGFQYPDTCDPR